MITDSWAGCYPSQWKGMIVPDAIAHPAKFSSRLIRRNLETRFLRPLTAAEMLNVVLTWWRWL